MKTPVALIIFNRPAYTEQSLAVIRQAKPTKLLVIADGPRTDRPDDIEKCAAARAVIDQVDWECEVLKNYSDQNLGCGIRPATGINWVFEHVEEAIILEDDCIPNPTFFQFCDELLEYYRDDERIMHISGNNYYPDKSNQNGSYVFSRYPLSWGWATWRRAWKHYDFDMKHWPDVKQKGLLNDLLSDQHVARTWARIFQDVIHTDLDCWDFQWVLTCWLQNGLSIVPNVNLVSNIGFGPDSTHTSTPSSTSADGSQINLVSKAMSFPINHPTYVVRDHQFDRFIQDTCFDYFPKLPKRIRMKFNRVFAK